MTDTKLVSYDLFPPVPSDTASAARFVFRANNFYLFIGNQANRLFSGLKLNPPYRRIDEPERTFAMLLLITIFQYMESLADHQADDALRLRVDWKYALHLPLEYPGLHSAAFCEFRKWLLVDQISQYCLRVLISRISEVPTANRKLPLSVDTTELVEGVCLLNYLALGQRAINELLEVLAIRQPEWLRFIALPQWYERYGFPQNQINTGMGKQDMEASIQLIHSDGTYLLKAVSESNNQAIKDLPQVAFMSQVWREQFVYPGGDITWMGDACDRCSIKTRKWDSYQH